jgi:acid phosphatase
MLYSSTKQFTPSRTCGPLAALVALISLTAAASGQTPAAITDQPVNEVVTEGWTATFGVTARGTGPLQYQWRWNGTNINGATSKSYTSPPVTMSKDGGVVDVRVTNAYGSTLSKQVTLSVQPAPPPTPAPAPLVKLPPINHVFVVVLENHSYSEMIGSGAMPYLQSLADRYALLTNFYGNKHPSISNYFVLTTGQVITREDNYGATVYEDNIVRRLTAKGKTWREYSEGLPSVGYFGNDTRDYRRHHNPLSYFSDVRESPAQQENLVPFSRLAADMESGQLPNFGLIIPTNAHNAHNGTLLTADQWMKANIDPLINDPQFQKDGLLFIVMDEGRKTDKGYGGGQIVGIAVGPWVKPGYRSGRLFQHQNILKTVCDLLGLGSFASPSLATANAASLEDCLIDGAAAVTTAQSSSASADLETPPQ